MRFSIHNFSHYDLHCSKTLKYLHQQLQMCLPKKYIHVHNIYATIKPNTTASGLLSRQPKRNAKINTNFFSSLESTQFRFYLHVLFIFPDNIKSTPERITGRFWLDSLPIIDYANTMIMRSWKTKMVKKILNRYYF